MYDIGRLSQPFFVFSKFHQADSKWHAVIDVIPLIYECPASKHANCKSPSYRWCSHWNLRLYPFDYREIPLVASDCRMEIWSVGKSMSTSHAFRCSTPPVGIEDVFFQPAPGPFWSPVLWCNKRWLMAAQSCLAKPVWSSVWPLWMPSWISDWFIPAFLCLS